MYLIRGTAKPESGFIVRFTETVPALKNQLSFLSPVGGVVAGKSIKLGSFTPAPSGPQISIPPSPLVPSGASPTLPINEDYSACDFNGILQLIDLPGIGRIGFVKVLGNTIRYYYSPPKGLVITMQDFMDRFMGLAEDQVVLTIIKTLKNNGKLTSLNGVELSNEEVKQLAVGALKSKKLWVPDILKALTNKQEDFVFPIMKQTTQNILQKLDHIISSGELLQWAEKENYFPDETLSLTWWDSIFYSPLAVRQLPESLAGNICYLVGVSGGSPLLFLYPPNHNQCYS